MLKRAAFLIGVLSLIGSCEAIDDLLTFSVSDSVTINVPASGINLPLEILSPEVSSSAKQEYSNNNTRADLVKDVRLTELKLTIQSPDAMDFDFLKSISVYISTGTDEEILLASLSEVPLNVKVIDLKTTKEKLDRFLRAETYQLRTAMTTRGAVEDETTILAGLKFRVTADPL